jgi:hypothetical protein
MNVCSALRSIDTSVQLLIDLLSAPTQKHVTEYHMETIEDYCCLNENSQFLKLSLCAFLDSEDFIDTIKEFPETGLDVITEVIGSEYVKTLIDTYDSDAMFIKNVEGCVEEFNDLLEFRRDNVMTQYIDELCKQNERCSFESWMHPISVQFKDESRVVQ